MQKRGLKFLNKKGTQTTQKMLEHLGKLAIIGIVTWFLFSYVNSIEKDAEFQKIFLSRDVALLTNTLYNAQGNVDYYYSFDKIDLSEFSFKFNQLDAIGKVPIVEVEEKGLRKLYPYAKPLQSEAPNFVSGAKSIKFSKTGSKITLTKNE